MLLTCDVHDGDAEAAKTVTFMVEGRSYECELCEAHLAEFRVAMEVWSSHARVAGRGSRVPSPIRPARRRRRGRERAVTGGDGPSTADVRDWARAQGMEVGVRGRVPDELREAYAAAH